MRVALVSAIIRDNEVTKQIAQIEEYLSKNKSLDLFCFGENYLQGFNALAWQYDLDKYIALSIDSDQINQIRQLAIKYNSAISFGFLENYNDDIYCSNMVIDKHGVIVDNYRRRSIGWKEIFDDSRYKEGNSFNVFKLNNKKIVTAICGDLWTEDLLYEIEIMSHTIDFILWPLYIDYQQDVWKTSAKDEYKNQLSSLQCDVLMINSYSHNLNEAKGGAYIFEGNKIKEELPLGNEGILIFDL